MRFRAQRVHKAKTFPPDRPEHGLLMRIADSQRPIVQANLVKGLTKFQSRVDLNEVLEAVNAGEISKLDRIVPYEFLAEDLKELEVIHQRGIIKGGEESQAFFKRSISRAIPTVNAGQFAFDADNPAVQAIIRSRTANLVINIEGSTRNTLKEITEEAIRRGMPPRETAKLVRRTVSLTPRQALAVQRFQEKVVMGDTGALTAFQRNSVRRTLRQRGPLEAGQLDELRVSQLDRVVDEYSARQLQLRAETIARTETFDAVNQGQLAVWQQAADQGLYDRNTAMKEWVVTADDRLCPICRPLQGVKVPMDELFPQVFLQAPPAHPRCRCFMAIVFGEESEVA